MAVFINTIVGVSSLTMTSGDFDSRWGYACHPCNHGSGHDHGRFPAEEGVMRYRCVEGRCWGCVLATVGGTCGNGSGLAVLWEAMGFRARNGGREPAMLRLVEAWIGLREGDSVRMIHEAGEQWVGFLGEVRGLVGGVGGDNIPPVHVWDNRTGGIRSSPRGGVGVKDSSKLGLRTQHDNDNLRGLYLAMQKLQDRVSVSRTLPVPVDG